jgi:hypothetical protein
MLAKRPWRAIGPSFAAYSPTISPERSARSEVGFLRAYVPTKPANRIEKSMVDRKRNVHCLLDSFGGFKGTGLWRERRVGRASLLRGSCSAEPCLAFTGELADLDIGRDHDEEGSFAEERGAKRRTRTGAWCGSFNTPALWFPLGRSNVCQCSIDLPTHLPLAFEIVYCSQSAQISRSIIGRYTPPNPKAL